MQEVKCPFNLEGKVSIVFSKNVKGMFFETDENNNYDIPLDDFAIKLFTYDAECQLLVVSLHKSFSLILASDYEKLGSGMELDLSYIKVELVYCLYNASIVSYEIKHDFSDQDLVENISISCPFKINLS